jgi:hypothetical protein
MPDSLLKMNRPRRPRRAAMGAFFLLRIQPLASPGGSATWDFACRHGGRPPAEPGAAKEARDFCVI